MLTNFYNPYSDQTFFGFFIQLFYRLISFIKGEFGLQELASDEIQMIVLCGVALSAGLVGCFLVLKKMTMLANSLSHTILLGIVVVFVVSQGNSLIENDVDSSNSINIHYMLLAALGMGLLTSFLTQFLTTTVKLQEDAATGIVFSSLFAVGIILATLLTRSAHIGIEVVMGNVDSLHWEDIKLVSIVCAINTIIFILFFKEFKITTFDPALANVLGFSPAFFNYLLMTQTSATSIGAFRAIGVLMVLAFIAGPPLMARLLTDDLKKMLLLSVIFGMLASILGVALSRHILTVYQIPLSTSGIVVCMLVVLFIGIAIFQKYFRGKIFSSEIKMLP